MYRGYEQHHVDGRRVYRFVRIERLMHWVNAVSFFVLVATGAVLLLRSPLSLSAESIEDLHLWHFIIGAVYFFGPALIFLIGDWRAGLRWTANAFRWTFAELIWLLGPLRAKLRIAEPEVGRFNAGQRVNLLAQLAGKWGMGVTGYFMHVAPGQLMMYDIHVVLFAVLFVVVLGHMYMGLINPPTRHSLHAMLSGFVDAEWVQHHHPRWLRTLPRVNRAEEELASGDAPAIEPAASPAAEEAGVGELRVEAAPVAAAAEPAAEDAPASTPAAEEPSATTPAPPSAGDTGGRPPEADDSRAEP